MQRVLELSECTQPLLTQLRLNPICTARIVLAELWKHVDTLHLYENEIQCMYTIQP